MAFPPTNSFFKAVMRGKDDAHLRDYYTGELGYLDSYGPSRWSLPTDEGSDVLFRNDYIADFESKIHFTQETGIFDGPYDQERRNVKIPDRFKDIF
jgi:hypothetical protein